MGGSVGAGNPCVKGAACQALDALSGNRHGLLNLQAGIASIAGANYHGLENVLGQHLLPVKYAAADVAKIVTHLKACWFDPTSSACFFSGMTVAPVYAQGMLKTIELSLASNTPVPIDSWWALDHSLVEMLNFATPRQVTLIIATPRPGSRADLAAAGGATVGFSTRHQDGRLLDQVLHLPKV